ncbi:MAG: sodium:solute symporter family protein [Spirochaetales bacterium]|nr:sodium:solute symporter family protein [Spirochaetales bacterium]
MIFSIQLLIVLLYFLLLLLVGWLTRRFAGTTTDYLIAGRNLGVTLCTAVILGEWLGGMSTVGTAEKAFTSGFFPLWYNVSTATGMVLFGLLLAAVYRRANVHTVGEMLEHLFDRTTRVITSLCFVVAFVILSYIQLQAIGSVAAQVLNLPYATAIVVAGIIVTAYVYFGGMRSIALTNLIHVLLLFATLITVFVVVLVRSGGYGGLFQSLDRAIGAAEAARFRNPFSSGLAPVAAWLLGGILAGFASQASIQPVFAARDIPTARRSSFLSALFIAPVGLLVSTLGIAARAGAAGALPPTAKQTLPFLLMSPSLLPPWLSGLALAGIFAAILSTVAPVLFAVSTILTKDLYQLLGRNVREQRLFRVSRLMVLAIGAITIPLAVFLKGVILDTAYITYAIRGSAAVAVLLGIYWVRRSKPVATALSVSVAMIASTTAALGFVIFEKSITGLLGFHVDKVFAALFFSLFFILLLTALSRGRGRVRDS